MSRVGIKGRRRDIEGVANIQQALSGHDDNAAEDGVGVLFLFSSVRLFLLLYLGWLVSYSLFPSHGSTWMPPLTQ